MHQTAEDNFVTENPETAPGSSLEGVTEVMDLNENVVGAVPDIPLNYMKNKTENPETVPGSSSEKITAVMDSNENVVDAVPDILSNYIKNGTENPEIGPGTSLAGITAVMDSNENAVDVVSNIQSRYRKNKTVNAKSKIQNDKTKKMTVAFVPQRKSLKRKAAHPPTSEMVMDTIRALKKRNGASFGDMRKYMEEKYVVDMKTLKYRVEKFLQKGVSDGVLEKIDRGGVEVRFKIKKLENIKKDSKTLPRKEGKEKPKKKMGATKKQAKK